jgi:hypothetical protein
MAGWSIQENENFAGYPGRGLMSRIDNESDESDIGSAESEGLEDLI